MRMPELKHLNEASERAIYQTRERANESADARRQ
jgi:hypothetical protein